MFDFFKKSKKEQSELAENAEVNADEAAVESRDSDTAAEDTEAETMAVEETGVGQENKNDSAINTAVENEEENPAAGNASSSEGFSSNTTSSESPITLQLGYPKTSCCSIA